MKTVLIITYHFPPDSAVGALRWQRFAKYLPDTGWSPHVLTVHEKYYEALDWGRLTHITPVPIARTREFASPRKAMLAARSRCFALLGRRNWLNQLEEVDRQLSFEARQAVHLQGSLLRRLFRALCWLPDDHVGWLIPGVTRGLFICRRQNIETILTSGPPWTAHLIGWWLKRLTKVCWIADFRDPWVYNPIRPKFFRGQVFERIEGAMEDAVVSTADRISAVNDHLRCELQQLHPRYRDRIFTIRNGYDPDDFRAPEGRQPGREFTIVHVGSLYYRRSPAVFLEAIGALIREGRIPSDGIRVVFVGDTRDGLDIDRLIENRGFGDVVLCIPPVAHADAIRWMRRADVLLVFAQAQPSQVPAKVFEYLATGAHILAITEGGATADLVRENGGDTCSGSAEDIARVVHRCYERYIRDGTQRVVGPGVQRYDVRQITRDLASLLNGSQDARGNRSNSALSEA